MTAIATQDNHALAVSSGAAYSLLMDDTAMARLERVADLMASGKTTIPQHLRQSKGDCFAVVLQSMQWGMNPFAVAQKTHLVNGTLGYEAQLVAAVINSSGAVKDRFNFEWFGPWEKIIGKFKEVESQTKKDENTGRLKKFIVPDWKQADEHGLGVKVWATLKGETQPRVLELLLTQARTRNSTLWTEDPKQQLAYLAQKRWSRLYAPDVILGVYTPDEIGEPGEKFMGMADVVAEPEASKFYTDTEFGEKKAGWSAVISGGRKTADELFAFVESKGTKLTDEQKDVLRKVKVKEPTKDDVQDVTPKPAADAPAPPPAEAPAAAPADDTPPWAPTVDPDQIAERMRAAVTLDELYDAANLMDALPDDPAQRKPLENLFNERVEALKG